MITKNTKYSALFSLHLFLITFYVHLFFDSSRSDFLFFQILGIFIHLLLGVILTRTVLDKITIYYSLVLCFFVYMFVFLGSPVAVLYHFSFSIVSFLSVLVLHFLVLFFLGEHTRTTKIMLGIQFLVSFVRNTMAYSTEPFRQMNIYFFFLGILLFYLFSSYLYKKESIEQAILTTKQKKKLFISTIISFAPFILFSLIPTILNSQSGIENFWTIIFFLTLPLAVADILTKENLIYQQYWKSSLIEDYLILSVTLVLLVLLLTYLFSFTLVERILLGHFLVFFLFGSSVIFQIYNERKKRR